MQYANEPTEESDTVFDLKMEIPNGRAGAAVSTVTSQLENAGFGNPGGPGGAFLHVCSHCA